MKAAFIDYGPGAAIGLAVHAEDEQERLLMRLFTDQERIHMVGSGSSHGPGRSGELAEFSRRATFAPIPKPSDTTTGDEGGEALRAAECRGDTDRAALLRFANRVLNRTKHGYQGVGPCAPDCLKCEAQRILAGGEP